ncbi:MAG: PAC2 family protein [Actinomycetota bacterium]|nr:PAC2 family protein [Actinomycetota bacterium]MDA3013085.1 PAC2 family protein [Actinomycetota bacterium]
MEDVVWYRKPLLSEPVAILAFEGWSDAGNTATGCVENISCTYDVEPFAELDSDSFYNYQMRRPIVEVKDFGEREFHWPQTSFYSIEDYKLKKDLILVFGEEPSMRWKEYAKNIKDVLVELGVKRAITLGAFFGQVAHTLPVPIFGVSTDPTFHSRFNILNPNYSGPTGITSVVGQTLSENEIETTGLWAAVPHYLSSGGYPKGMSALINKTSEILKIDLDDSGIQTEGQQFELKINKAMENSQDLAEYVSRLEESEVNLENNFSEDNLVQQIEDFLSEERDN